MIFIIEKEVINCGVRNIDHLMANILLATKYAGPYNFQGARLWMI